MSTLIIAWLILLPVLVVILNIDWVNQITYGEIITVCISVVGGLLILARIIWLRRATYIMTFSDNPNDFPPSNPQSQNYPKIAFAEAANVDNTAVIYARIQAKRGVEFKSVSFRLVNKLRKKICFFPIPMVWWDKATSIQDRVCIEVIWDAEYDYQKGMNPFQLTRSLPVSQTDTVGKGGCRLDFKETMYLLPMDSLWLRIIINVENNWEGYIEFNAPSPSKSRASTRAKISLKQASHKECSQNQ